jgi:hypothetical protein
VDSDCEVKVGFLVYRSGHKQSCYRTGPFMDLSAIDHIAAAIDIVVAPAILAATLPLYWKWFRNVRGRRTVQIVAVGIVAVAFLFDAGDRLGAFGPTRHEMAKSLLVLDKKREHLQGESDHRRIVIEGVDGNGGLRKRVVDLTVEAQHWKWLAQHPPSDTKPNGRPGLPAAPSSTIYRPCSGNSQSGHGNTQTNSCTR